MRLSYRAPKVAGRFAVWLDAAKGRSGVYVFRSAVSGRALYIGESHSDSLYKTITRHFWSWKDKTRPHYTVGVLSSVELAIVLVPKSRAVQVQNDLIERLRPLHNGTNPNAYDDIVPF